jgi:hypothetical protein
MNITMTLYGTGYSHFSGSADVKTLWPRHIESVNVVPGQRDSCFEVVSSDAGAGILPALAPPSTAKSAPVM